MKKYLFALSLALIAASVSAGETKVTWHGHAAFEIVTPKGAVFLIDPWLSNPKNPANKDGADLVGAFDKVDYIMVTHAHFDHTGEAVAIAKKTGARLSTNYELGTNMAKILGFPGDQMGFDSLFNIGGKIPLANGEVMASLVPAVHSSGMKNPDAKKDQPDIVYGGNPAGIVLEIKDGPVIYHTGDTAYFDDMKNIKDFGIDVALVNFGGHFGMEPDMAAKAAKAVGANLTIPMHYGTFPILTQSTDEIEIELKKKGRKYLILEPGESVVFEGKKVKE